MKKKMKIILDLDGVLITTPLWKADEMDTDDYSMFNHNCVQNFNQLLEMVDAEIWLSSIRRTTKTIREFNAIFQHRNIKNEISGFLPVYSNCKNRKEEIEQFVNEIKTDNYLIIDDDKSLYDLSENIKKRLIHTKLMSGFDQEKLEEFLTFL